MDWQLIAIVLYLLGITVAMTDVYIHGDAEDWTLSLALVCILLIVFWPARPFIYLGYSIFRRFS